MDFQIKRYFYLFSLTWVFSAVCAVNFIPENEEGNVITIRGFLYQSGPKEVFLSSLPTLRSCCYDKGEVEKIYIREDFPQLPPGHVVEVVGRLQKDAGRWQLTEAALIANSAQPEYALIAIVSVIFIICLYAGYIAYRKKG